MTDKSIRSRSIATQFYTVAEIATQLGCKPDLVRSHINSGKLRAINIGTKSTNEYRVNADSLLAFLDSIQVRKQPKKHVSRKPVVQKSKWIRDLKKEAKQCQSY